MATKYQPTKQTLPANDLWQWLQNQLSFVASGGGGGPRAAKEVGVSLNPVGNYSGDSYQKLTNSNTVLNNPWGVQAAASPRQDFFGLPSFTLAAGQSLDLKTGRLSDPRLHAGTAARLNQAIQQRQVQEAGLDKAAETTARGKTSVLASLDNLYFANQATSVPTSEALTAQAQAKQGGLDSLDRKTLLGVQKPAAPITAPSQIRGS